MPTPYREPHAGQFLGTLAYRKRATRRQARRTQFWRRPGPWRSPHGVVVPGPGP